LPAYLGISQIHIKAVAGNLEIVDLLKVMVEKDASDLYLVAGSPPVYRIEGISRRTSEVPLAPQDIEGLARSSMSNAQWAQFGDDLEMDLVISLADLSRFRVNAFRQRGSIGLVIRKVKFEIESIDALGLPPILKEISVLKKGLILVVGAAGTGKSTTLAAMIDYRNAYGPGHIITVEDPIEFVHKHKQCLVSQRELGFDTHSFGAALKHAVRQAPDVILIGEIRDTESMEAAISFADTGHLCMATLHSTNAMQSFERVLNFFPATRHAQVLMQLSLNLRAIIAQRLIPSLDGARRFAAVEVLLDTPRIRELIKTAEINALRDAMEQAIHEGCQTFDQALFLLYQEGLITLDQALANADSANNLRLKIKLEGLKQQEAAKTSARSTESLAENPRAKKDFVVRRS
jgi:twitching motility protein PilU